MKVATAKKGWRGLRTLTVREVIDIAPIRAEERWDRFEHSEELMDQASFVHLRTRIWRLLRGEQQPDAEAALTSTGGGIT